MVAFLYFTAFDILLLAYCYCFSTPSPLPSTTTTKKNQIQILCQNLLTRELKIKVVGFVLKKLFTYFEMLIVPHVLPRVDSCIFVFYLL